MLPELNTTTPISALPLFIRERYYEIRDLAGAWKLSYWTVRRAVIGDHKIHQDYPCISNPKFGKRRKHTYRIPEHVAERIYRNLCKRGGRV